MNWKNLWLLPALGCAGAAAWTILWVRSATHSANDYLGVFGVVVICVGGVIYSLMGRKGSL